MTTSQVLEDISIRELFDILGVPCHTARTIVTTMLVTAAALDAVAPIPFPNPAVINALTVTAAGRITLVLQP